MNRRLIEQRSANIAWTAGILAALALMLALLGWLVAGAAGLVWALVMGALILSAQQMSGAEFLRRALGAELMPEWLAPDLHEAVFKLAGRAGFARPPRLHYIPTPAVQALAVGCGESAAIGLSEGLLRVLSPRELTAVIAHEMWHVRQGDPTLIRIAAAVTQLTQALCLAGYALCFFALPLVAAGKVELAWPIFPLLALAPAASTLLWPALSRVREFDADAGSAALTGDPMALASALRRLELLAGRQWEALSGGGLAARWLSTHPSAEARIARLLALVPARRRVARRPRVPELGWRQYPFA